MNKLKLIFLFIFFNFNLFSQTATFPSPGLELGRIYNCNYFDMCDYVDQGIYFTNSDTILCGKTYQFFKSFHNQYYQIFTRQEDGKVYIGNCNYEQLLYDFNLDVGDVFQVAQPPLTLSVDSITQVTLLNGESRKSIWLHNLDAPNDVRQWVDGLGDVNWGLTYTSDWEGGYEEFICAKDSSGLLWLANNHTNIFCDSLTCYRSIPQFSYQTNNQEVTFENLSVYAESWIWDFGDGNFSTEEHPTHIYNSVGCYEVRLTASNNCSDGKTILKKINIDFTSPWTKINLADSLVAGSSYFVTSEIGWLHSSSSIFKTIDGGINWEEQTIPHPPSTNINISSIDFLDQNIGLVSAYYPGGSNLPANIYKTIDGGNTWTPLDPNQGTHLYNIEILNENFMYATGQFRDFLLSEDGGNTWVEKEIPNTWPSELTQFYAINEDTIFGIGHTYNFGVPSSEWTTIVTRTFDGENWEVFDFTNYPIMRDLFFIDAEEGWMVGDHGTIAHTTDGGETWETQFSQDFSFTDITFVDNLTGWVVGAGGRIFHTTDGGQNWIPQICDGINGFWSISFPTPEVGYASGQGEFYKYCGNPSCDETSIFEVNQSIPALNFQPNPFNDFTILKFENPNHQPHQFILTDISGKIVLNIKDITESELKIQSNTIPSGLYFGELFQENNVVGIGKIVISQ